LSEPSKGRRFPGPASGNGIRAVHWIIEVGVILVALAIAYASNKHRIAELEQKHLHEVAINKELTDHIRILEQKIAVIEQRAWEHDKRLDGLEHDLERRK
jgi:hypothetical protein